MFLIIVASDDLNCGGQWRCTAESAPSLLDCYNQGYMFPLVVPVSLHSFGGSTCTCIGFLHVDMNFKYIFPLILNVYNGLLHVE